ncbi:MAG: hypothetical protein KDE35_15900 [Geminicoccaceae bacterium]|nr:hypothetical protein [Geminicoccaceae bacterium]
MRLVDRIVKAIQFSVRVNDKLGSLSEKVERLSGEVRHLDRRLVRVETAMELASNRAFRPLPPAGDG